MAARVICQGNLEHPAAIAGVDVTFSPDGQTAIAGVVLLNFPELTIIEKTWSVGPMNFPYIPGLLSFREAPIILHAVSKLRHNIDLIMVDGQGYAHPRRFGLACHLGVALDCPSIGCAKSRLIGTYEEPHQQKAARSDLFDGPELIGAVLRTRKGVKPLYVSIGHKVTLDQAVQVVLSCCPRYRLAEPIRQAHRYVTALRLDKLPATR